jgi:hypothetical protein
MSLILSEILTLSQHLNALEQTPELYRPNTCIHCHETVIWRYGYYYRKPDRLNHGEDSLNDIPIPRFQCVACRRTFSTLPECIAPRRWYPWFVQQWCLYCCLKGSPTIKSGFSSVAQHNISLVSLARRDFYRISSCAL